MGDLVWIAFRVEYDKGCRERERRGNEPPGYELKGWIRRVETPRIRTRMDETPKTIHFYQTICNANESLFCAGMPVKGCARIRVWTTRGGTGMRRTDREDSARSTDGKPTTTARQRLALPFFIIT